MGMSERVVWWKRAVIAIPLPQPSAFQCNENQPNRTGLGSGINHNVGKGLIDFLSYFLTHTALAPPWLP